MLTRYGARMWLLPAGRVSANNRARGRCSILIAVLLPLLAACGTLPPQPTTAVGAAPSSETATVPDGLRSSDTAATAAPESEGGSESVTVPEGLQSSDTAAAAAPESEGVLGKTRKSVRWAVEWLARHVDGWFGDIPFEQGGRVTNGELGLAVLKPETESTTYRLRFNAQFRLPNIEKSAYAFVGRDNQREVVADIPGALKAQQRLQEERTEDQSFFAGLGLPVSDVLDFRVGVRGGFKPYAQARYQQPWRPSERDLVEFDQTLFWTENDQFGSTTTLWFERMISSTLAIRWVNAGTITQQSKNYAWSSKLGAYKGFGEQRLLSLEALVIVNEGTGVAVNDYGLQTRWEQPIYKDWLLAEFDVGRFYPRKDAASERAGSWALGCYVKMRF